MSNFIHLHNHTHYSLLDAMTTPKELIMAAKQNNMPAIAITDHGVMFGCLEFYKIAKENGIKPIIGIEAYMANGSMHEKVTVKGKKNYFHVVLLAKNETGYKNLLKLTSISHTEGFYYKPRIDRQLLEQYKEGIICLSACMGGVVGQLITEGDIAAAREAVEYYKNLFQDDFYLEIQNHFLDNDPKILAHVPKLALEFGVKLVATNDIHYLEKEHAVAHNTLLLIRDGNANSTEIDIEKLVYRQPEFYFKTEEEMVKLFKDYPEALTNTLEVAEKCNLELELDVNHMPKFPIPENFGNDDENEYFRYLVYEGLKHRFTDITPEIKERVDFELSTIIRMGFPGYFLIVWDFIRAAREMGIRVGPGRGSAAGSMVAYCLRITDIDPLKFDLLFERFLNPDRISMPDIDIDFNDLERERVIEYVKNKYGSDSVSMIITFNKLSSKAVLTDVGRVLGFKPNEIKRITAKIPTKFGKVAKLKDAIELPEIAPMLNYQDDRIDKLIKISLLLEDKVRGTGIHAAGVIIAPADVSNYVPIYKSPSTSKENASIEVATQFPMDQLEKAGLLKMDFLGLRTLSIIENTLTMIKENRGIDLDIDNLPLDDKKTYDLLSDGRTLAIFQFESKGMQEYLRKLKPDNIEDIAAMNALYRPGPMDNIPEFIDRKNGRKPIEYLHPLLEQSLASTYGIMVFQEQVMKIVRQLAGFTMGQADGLRKAMGKKLTDKVNEMQPMFIEGAAKNGIEKKTAESIFEAIRKFGDYGFNKSHSIAYSFVAYQTAFLKAHYTPEFLAANMTAEYKSQDKISQLREEAEELGLKLMPPDINYSNSEFTVKGDIIYFGLSAIRNVGVAAVLNIMEARKKGNFTSLFDFMSKVDNKLITRRTLEGLICTGAFDSLQNGHRSQLFAAIDSALEFSKYSNQSQQENVVDIFASMDSKITSIKEPTLPNIPAWTMKESLEKEKEFLDFYFTGHPLMENDYQVHSISNYKLSEKSESLNNIKFRSVVYISSIRTQLDKRQKTIAFLEVEDLFGKAEVMVWSNVYSKFAEYIIPDTAVYITGKASLEDEQIKIAADEIYPAELATEKIAKGFSVRVDLNINEKVENIKKLADLGNAKVIKKSQIQFNLIDSQKSFRRSYLVDSLNLECNDQSLKNLTELFGTTNVRLIV